MHLGHLSAVLQIVESLCGARTSEDLGGTTIPCRLIKRRQPGAAGNRYDFSIFFRSDRDTVGASNISPGADCQVHQGMGEDTNVDDHQ